MKQGHIILLTLTFLVLLLLHPAFAQNWTVSTLYSFGTTNGVHPSKNSLVQGRDGYLYGSTASGGSNDNGTMFRMTTNGTLTTLCMLAGTNGDYPDSALVQASEGNLYGATAEGGNSSRGTLYRFTTNGAFTNLVLFLGGANGARAKGGLIQGQDGKLYGTTESGGLIGSGYGTVYAITTDGVFAVVASFDKTNGANPYGELTQVEDGSFYGVAAGGGAYGFGTLYHLTTNSDIIALHHFDATNGALPVSKLAKDGNGNFYGTTFVGGPYNLGSTLGSGTGNPTNGLGVIFKCSTNGAFTVLHYFDGTNGAYPISRMTLGRDGKLYGTTQYGGADNSAGGPSGYGIVYQITTNGIYTPLISFHNTNGNTPCALVLHTNGNIYGMASGGGTNLVGILSGTFFRLNAPALPALSITTSNSGALIKWLEAGTSANTLQTNSNLVTTNWTNAGLPVNDDGTNKSVTFPAPANNLFFRLIGN